MKRSRMMQELTNLVSVNHKVDEEGNLYIMRRQASDILQGLEDLGMLPPFNSWAYYTDGDKADEKSITVVSYRSVPQKYVLPQGDELRAFSIRAPSDLIRRIDSVSDQYEFTICACSFYKDCWISKGQNAVPQPINECNIDPNNHFQSDKN